MNSSVTVDGFPCEIMKAHVDDCSAILELQRLAYAAEARLYGDWSLPPLTQTFESLLEEIHTREILKACLGSEIIGSVRARIAGQRVQIGRLIVHPGWRGRGLGSRLLADMERSFPDAEVFELFTGSKSESNLRFYARHGYRVSRTERLSDKVSLTFLEKPGR